MRESGVPENRVQGYSRNWKIINRAEKGSMAGRAWCGVYDGRVYPDGADTSQRDAEDEAETSTWLQPGEEMVIDREAAMHFCGRLFDPLMPDKLDIIRMYGDYQYRGYAPGSAPKVVTMVKTGPPLFLPDLLVVEVDQRGKELGARVSLFERYTKNEVFAKAVELVGVA